MPAHWLARTVRITLYFVLFGAVAFPAWTRDRPIRLWRKLAILVTGLMFVVAVSEVYYS